MAGKTVSNLFLSFIFLRKYSRIEIVLQCNLPFTKVSGIRDGFILTTVPPGFSFYRIS
jgi:hypothetical protein